MVRPGTGGPALDAQCRGSSRTVAAVGGGRTRSTSSTGRLGGSLVSALGLAQTASESPSRMFGQILAIARNTFFESIRQPVVLVVFVVAAILIVLSNPFAAFTMQDDQRMFIDLGLSTIFICGTLLAAFIATNVISQEIENRTVLTVISKPVGRTPFILGKYLGVAGAILVVLVDMALVFMLVERHGTMQTVTTPHHLPVLLFGVAGMALAIAIGVWCNFFYGKAFGSTVLFAALPLLAVAYGLTLLFKHDFSADAPAEAFKLNIWMAIVGMWMALLVLTAFAVAISTRLGQVLTIAATLGIFMLGMLSDWIFGRPAAKLAAAMVRADESFSLLDPHHWLWLLCKVAYLLVPNFQVFWLSDAVTQKREIPFDYMLTLVPYAGLNIVVAMAIAVALFQEKDVG